MPGMAEVLEIIDIDDTTYLIRFKILEPADFSFKPGQFISFAFERGGKKVLKQYSIASPPSTRSYLELCIKLVEGGQASNYFHRLKKGERLEFSGPAGVFVLKYPLPGDAVFAATGTGVAPFRSMIRVIFEKGTDKQVWLFHGVRFISQLAYREEFESLASKHANFHYIPVVSRPGAGWGGASGHIQEHIKETVSNCKGKSIYICGVLLMCNEVKKLAEEMGFLKENTHLERYV